MTMVISKVQKKQLIEQYVSALKAAHNVCISTKCTTWLDSTRVLKEVLGAEWKFNVVPKRLYFFKLILFIFFLKLIEGPFI